MKGCRSPTINFKINFKEDLNWNTTVLLPII